MEKILVIDDETVILSSLKYLLEDYYKVYTTEDYQIGIDLIVKENINIILLDLRLENVSGLDVLEKILEKKPEALIIMMTAYSSIKTSLKAIEIGAFYYLSKPIENEELLFLLNKASEKLEFKRKIANLEGYIKKDIIGNSKKIKSILSLINQIKDFNSNVLITGESGTGKELVAQKIHYSSLRKGQPFNAINCAVIPANLFESELFGYKKGSFSGAHKDEIGIIRKADKGTLFLDEIGEMDINLQSKLLRFIQEREVRPIGSDNTYKVDVRIICATNKNLEKEIERGTFRKDLFYRINVINIHLPPLRERKKDIKYLTLHFIQKYNICFNKNITTISEEALSALEEYYFDGNIRELENIIERSVLLSTSNVIQLDSLKLELKTNTCKNLNNENTSNSSEDYIKIIANESLKEIEKKAIKLNLEYNNNNRKRTAESLGISERSLRYKIKEYGLN